jgi:hypothetical protein
MDITDDNRRKLNYNERIQQQMNTIEECIAQNAPK